MIENNAQLAAALFQMESLADTLEGMRRHALDTEDCVFATTSGGFVAVLRERIADARAYVEHLPDAPQRNGQGTSRQNVESANPGKELVA